MKKIPNEIKDYISYDPITGKLTWINRLPYSRTKIGDEVLSQDSRGYYRIKFARIEYKAHRLAWFLQTSTQPNTIDHIDGNPANNVFTNLRSVTQKENSCNKVMHRRGAIPGVSFNTKSGKWISYVSIKGKRKHLGLFVVKEDAVAAINKELK